MDSLTTSVSLQKRVAFFFCLLLSFSVSVLAQQLPLALEMTAPGISSYDPTIPTPESIIGHQIGTRHTFPYQVEAYFRAVADASDRVVLEEHGRTYEGRALIHAIVTSSNNQARLDELRIANLALSDSPASVSDAQIAQMPVILYQGFSIHGNEASGTEAAILYLYHLAAGRGPAVDDALEDAVIILDPMLNPDGRDRFTDWVNRNRGGVAVSDPRDREHNEPWPGGRTNHYWFDLNRDWMASQHPESRGRLEVFHSWRPQVLTDHHEMGGGSTFFFQPGIPSRNNPNTPQETYELTAAIAEYHARGLDRIGSQYYSEESFDDFFYGKGSAYPDINGAVGILFEQASSRALKTEVTDGTLHFAFTVRNQFVASLTTLEAGVALRERLLGNQRKFYADAAEMARTNPVKAYVISLDRGRTRAQILAGLLARHRVEVYELAQNVTIDGTEFSAGEAYVIPMAQPQMRLIKAVMEKTLVYNDSLFYDVSTWTLPLAFDVDYAEFKSDAGRILGPKLPNVIPDGGKVVGGTADYAYLLKWDRYYAPRALYRILEAGITPRMMREPFSAEVEGELIWFDRGTIVVPLRGRESSSAHSTVHDLVQTAAAEDHVNFYAVSTGLTPDGPDLGGASTRALELPTIAILTGSGMRSGEAGEAWHLISERFQLPVSLLDAASIRGSGLDRYSVIIMPGGSLPETAAGSLKDWVRAGGRLVVMSGGAGWAISQEYVDLESKPFEMDSLMADLPYDKMDEARGAQAIGGAIFELSIDTTHPLGYGLPELLPVFHSGSTFYSAPEQPGTGIGVYSDRGLLSGYISDAKMKLVPGSAGVVTGRMGRGGVVLFMDRLSFRAYWYGSQRLLMNALFLGGLF